MKYQLKTTNVLADCTQSKRERIYAKVVEKYHYKLELKRGTVTGKISVEAAQDVMRDAVAYALSLM